MSGSASLKAHGVQALAQHCAGLTFLNLANCPKIADDAVERLSHHCRKLQDLDLSGCRKVSPVGIDTLTSCCTRLFSLNLTDCHRISRPYLQQKVLTYLLTHLPT